MLHGASILIISYLLSLASPHKQWMPERTEKFWFRPNIAAFRESIRIRPKDTDSQREVREMSMNEIMRLGLQHAFESQHLCEFHPISRSLSDLTGHVRVFKC